MRTLLISILSIAFIYLTNNITAQSLGKGAVAFSGEVDGVYFNVSGDLKIEQFVVYGSTAYVKLNWNWMKVNHIEYNGVLYDSNYNLIEANFDYLKSDFNGLVELRDYIPTKIGLQRQEQTVYAGSGANYSFDMDKETWNEMDADGRAKIRAEWEKKPFVLGVTLKSINGTEITSMIHKVKKRHQDLKAAEENEKKFYALIDEGERAVANSDYNEAIVKYQKALDLNVRNDLAEQRLTQARELKEDQEQEIAENQDKSDTKNDSNYQSSSNDKKKGEEQEEQQAKKSQDNEKENSDRSNDFQSDQNIVVQSAANQYLEIARKAEASGDLDRAITYYEKAYAEEQNYSTTVKINSLRQRKSVNQLNNTIDHYSQQYERNRERARQMIAEMEQNLEQLADKKKTAYQRDKSLYKAEYDNYISNFDQGVEQNSKVSDLKSAVLNAANGAVIYFTIVHMTGPTPHGFAGGKWNSYEYDSRLSREQNYNVTIYQGIKEIRITDSVKKNIDEFVDLFLKKNCVQCEGEKKFEKNSIIAAEKSFAIFDYLTESFTDNLNFAKIWSKESTYDIGSDALTSQQNRKTKFDNSDIEWIKHENRRKSNTSATLEDFRATINSDFGSFYLSSYPKSLVYYNNGKYIRMYFTDSYGMSLGGLTPYQVFTEKPYQNAWSHYYTLKQKPKNQLYYYRQIPTVKEDVYYLKETEALYLMETRLIGTSKLPTLYSSITPWTKGEHYFALEKYIPNNPYWVLKAFPSSSPRLIIEIGSFEYDNKSIYTNRLAASVIQVGRSYLRGDSQKKRGDLWIYNVAEEKFGWHTVPRKYLDNKEQNYGYEEQKMSIENLDHINFTESAIWTIPEINNGRSFNLGQNPADFEMFYNIIKQDGLSYLGEEFNVSFESTSNSDFSKAQFIFEYMKKDESKLIGKVDHLIKSRKEQIVQEFSSSQQSSDLSLTKAETIDRLKSLIISFDPVKDSSSLMSLNEGEFIYNMKYNIIENGEENISSYSNRKDKYIVREYEMVKYESIIDQVWEYKCLDLNIIIEVTMNEGDLEIKMATRLPFLRYSKRKEGSEEKTKVYSNELSDSRFDTLYLSFDKDNPDHQEVYELFKHLCLLNKEAHSVN